MGGVLIGYAGVSIDAQDLTAQRDALQALGVAAKLVFDPDGRHAAERRAGHRRGRDLIGLRRGYDMSRGDDLGGGGGRPHGPQRRREPA